MAKPTRSPRSPAAAVRSELEVELIAAERRITELMARPTGDPPGWTEQLIELVVRAPARERFRARTARPLDPAAQAQISEAQADTIVAVVTRALDDLGLQPEQVYRARSLIAAGLRAAGQPPTPEAYLAGLDPSEREVLRGVIDAELARRRGEDQPAEDRHDRGIVTSAQQSAEPSRAG